MLMTTLPLVVSNYKAPAHAAAASLSPDEADKESITYGEFVQSVYDSLNTNEDSEFYNFPLYGKSNFLVTVGLPSTQARYSISHYIYATVRTDILWWKVESGTTWIGYIAESNPEETQRRGFHDLVLVLRGTSSNSEWGKDCTAYHSEFKTVDGDGNKVSLGEVHEGFLSMYTSKDESMKMFGDSSMKEQIVEGLKGLVSKYNGEMIRITVTGHSLGAALATLVACDMAVYFSKHENVSVALFTFGSPRVGDATFKSNIEASVPDIWRYASKGDPVPTVPPADLLFWSYYEHVGVQRKVDASPSPYIREIGILEATAWHNLELYMHAIAAHSVSSVTVATSPHAVAAAAASVSLDDVFEKLKDVASEEDVSKLEHLMSKEKYKYEPAVLAQYVQDLFHVTSKTQETQAATPKLPNKRRRLLRSSALANSLPDSPFNARPYTLLNKSSDIVKEELKIPKNWIVAPNKDMVMIDGEWLPREQRPAAIPGYDNAEYN